MNTIVMSDLQIGSELLYWAIENEYERRKLLTLAEAVDAYADIFSATYPEKNERKQLLKRLSRGLVPTSLAVIMLPTLMRCIAKSEEMSDFRIVIIGKHCLITSGWPDHQPRVDLLYWTDEETLLREIVGSKMQYIQSDRNGAHVLTPDAALSEPLLGGAAVKTTLGQLIVTADRHLTQTEKPEEDQFGNLASFIWTQANNSVSLGQGIEMQIESDKLLWKFA